MTYPYKFKAGYTTGGTATTPSVAPTVKVFDVAGGSLLITAGTATAAGTAIPGLYFYTYNGTAGLDLVALFTTTDTTVDQVDLHSYVPDVILELETLGAGSVSWTVTVNDGTDPLDGVEVWVTTDLAGANVVASGETDALGQVTFLLDAGTYYCWKTLAGYNFANPETMVVA